MSYTKVLSVIIGVLLLWSTPLEAKRVYVSHQGGKEIFKTQNGTGVYASENCAPTSVAMIRAWLGLEEKSVSEIRAQMTIGAGWIYTDEVRAYLTQVGIPYQWESLGEPSDLIDALEEGVVLMCIDISKITRGTTPSLLGKTSIGGTGHFLVASGYYLADQKAYIEVLDPLNNGIRYYPLEELFGAASSWWPYLITIEEHQEK